jgi:hypothetical protein
MTLTTRQRPPLRNSTPEVTSAPMRRIAILVPSIALVIAATACTPSRNEIAQARADTQGKEAAQPKTLSARDVLQFIDQNIYGPAIVRHQDLVGPPSIVLPSSVAGLRMVWHSDRPLAIVNDGFTAEETSIITKLSAMKSFGATPVVAGTGPGVADLHVLIQRLERNKWRLKTIVSDTAATAVVASWYTDVFTDRQDAIEVAMSGWNSWFLPRDNAKYATTHLMKTKVPSALNDQVAAFEAAYAAGTADPAAASAAFGASIDKVDGGTPAIATATSYAAGYNALLLDFIATGQQNEALARSLSAKHIGAGTWTREGWEQVIRFNLGSAIRSHARPEPTAGGANVINAGIYLTPGDVIPAQPAGGIVRIDISSSRLTGPQMFLGEWPANEAMPPCSAHASIFITNTSSNLVTLKQVGVFDVGGRPLEATIAGNPQVDPATGAVVLAPKARLEIQVAFRIPNQTGQSATIQIGSISGIPTAVDGTGTPTATAMVPVNLEAPKRVPYSRYK